jgi:hypothetical protein
VASLLVAMTTTMFNRKGNMDFDGMDLSNAWQVLGMGLALALAAFIGIYVFAPKNVDYYYLSTSNSGSRGLGFCVYAHWTWHSDEIAYCTDKKDDALDFVAKANATVAHK